MSYLENFLINLLGTALGIFTTIMLFEALWARKKVKVLLFISYITFSVLISVVLAEIFLNSILLLFMGIIISFLLSCFYISNIPYRLLISIIVAAIGVATELLISLIFVRLLLIPIEVIQSDVTYYSIGMTISKLFSLFMVLILRMFMGKYKQNVDRQFNLLMAFMPFQAIIICYMVFANLIYTNTHLASQVGIAAVVLSILLIFITMFILEKQRKASMYKKEYEISQMRLDMQLNHYREVYLEQTRIKKMRHEMNNNLIAISGILKAGNTSEAIGRLEGIQKEVVRAADIIDTGFPSIDAMINAKTARANESGIEMQITVLLDGELFIDQFDIAVIIANALDNAIEGIIRSSGVEKIICFSISRNEDYISVFVDNYALGPIHDDFVTSKPDKKSHGFGLQQIKDIASKYNGSVRPVYNNDEKRFSLKIMLKNQSI